MKFSRRTLAVAVAALGLALSPVAAQAAPTAEEAPTSTSGIQADVPGAPNQYPNPNPGASPVADSPGWFCFQWGPGPAPGTSNTQYKVWCAKGEMPGTIYGSNGVRTGELAWTTCGNGYPKDHTFNQWACNAVWKSYPFPTAF